jgi:hypothetical protein
MKRRAWAVIVLLFPLLCSAGADPEVFCGQWLCRVPSFRFRQRRSRRCHVHHCRCGVEIYAPGRDAREGCWRISGDGECIMGIATVNGQVAILTAKVTAGATGVNFTWPAAIIGRAHGEELDRVTVGGVSGRGLSTRTGSGKFVIYAEHGLIAITVTPYK